MDTMVSYAQNTTPNHNTSASYDSYEPQPASTQPNGFEHHSPLHASSHNVTKHDSINAPNLACAQPRQTSAIPRFSVIPRLAPVARPQTAAQSLSSQMARVYLDGDCRTEAANSSANSELNSPNSVPDGMYSCVVKSDTTKGRSRGLQRRSSQQDRSLSEHPMKQDTESDTSSVFSSSGPPKMINSKIGSLTNAKHVPGGGNVQIFNEPVNVGPIKSKCNSLVNAKHKPSGGNIEIVNQKLEFTSNSKSKIASLDNVKHTPGGGNIQIFDEKVGFDKIAKPKIGSLHNSKHRATSSSVQIFNERLPWLKYNKPNLAEEERLKINKRSVSTYESTLNGRAVPPRSVH